MPSAGGRPTPYGTGVAIAPKGRWARLDADGRNINWTTSDALADLAGQSTFHSNLVEVRLVSQAGGRLQRLRSSWRTESASRVEKTNTIR